MRRGRRDGFTLIEALAAFVILAALTVVIQRGIVAASVASTRADDAVAAERVARSLLATPFALVAGSRIAGELDGRAYTVTAEALPFAAAEVDTSPGDAGGEDEGGEDQNGGDGNGETVEFVPLRVRISVDRGRGGSLSVETVRIVQAAP